MNAIRIITIAVSVFAAALVVACSSSAKFSNVKAPSFEKAIEHGGVQLVDVRDSSEFADGHIKGATNINVNSGNFESEAVAKLQKDMPVYVYCRSGRRSKQAADILAAKGYKVVNLEGGILGWTAAGLPVVKTP